MKIIPTPIETIHGETVQNGIQTPENPIMPVSLNGFERKMTNGDRIRAMTNEELVGILYCNQCIYRGMPECEQTDCEYGILAWLKQEVQENDER